ncbi:MAG TPA: rod shape-determining protein RodA [Alphaproteobacteria bacterium]|nr:rod shape-determining protein RodA [Alphaproteobacteria bacterium]
MAILSPLRSEVRLSVGEKLWNVNWGLVVLLAAVSAVGFAMLYSAANGSWNPWASRQIIRFGFGVAFLVAAALVDVRHWMRLSYPLYFLALILLCVVDIAGADAMGAQRWIDFHYFQLQPSELMKVGLVMALARYFHGIGPDQIGRISLLFVPLMLIVAPVLLVLKQPDLGTAVMLLASGAAMFFLAGVRMWKFALVLAGAVASVPVVWHFLHPYQKARILTFLDPERDPLGAGYHILQSKIALGSGGIFGKGFMLGTQSHLNFLPEKQTDFIFTMLAEEFGIVGGIVLLSLYALVLVYGIAIALRSRNQYGRLLAMGITVTFFLYVFVNIAMVMGLLPVVGVPLPLVSYGGTSMLSILFSFGLVISVYVHRDVRVGRRGSGDRF